MKKIPIVHYPKRGYLLVQSGTKKRTIKSVSRSTNTSRRDAVGAKWTREDNINRLNKTWKDNDNMKYRWKELERKEMLVIGDLKMILLCREFRYIPMCHVSEGNNLISDWSWTFDKIFYFKISIFFKIFFLQVRLKIF